MELICLRILKFKLMRNLGIHITSKADVLRHYYDEYDMRTFQMMLGSPQQRTSVDSLLKKVSEFTHTLIPGDCKIVVHAPYWYNLVRKDMIEKTREDMMNRIKAASRIGAQYFVVHPGYRGTKAMVEDGTALDVSAATENCAAFCTELVSLLKERNIKLLLENCAGSFNGMMFGSCYEIYTVLQKCSYPLQLGFCFDTCHAWANGENWEHSDWWNYYLDLADVIHLNSPDCGDFGAHVDRHSSFPLQDTKNLSVERIRQALETGKTVIMETEEKIAQDDFWHFSVDQIISMEA